MRISQVFPRAPKTRRFSTNCPGVAPVHSPSSKVIASLTARACPLKITRAFSYFGALRNGAGRRRRLGRLSSAGMPGVADVDADPMPAADAAGRAAGSDVARDDQANHHRHARSRRAARGVTDGGGEIGRQRGRVSGPGRGCRAGHRAQCRADPGEGPVRGLRVGGSRIRSPPGRRRPKSADPPRASRRAAAGIADRGAPAGVPGIVQRYSRGTTISW